MKEQDIIKIRNSAGILDGHTNSIAGIPIEIDDDIENEYEVVYEEN